MKRNPETAWLAEAISSSLQQTLRDLDRAYMDFFKKRARFPQFKTKRTDRPRFRASEDVTISNGTVRLPKMGRVRIRQSREVTGKPKSATFKQDTAGHWHVTLISEFTMPDTTLPQPNPSAVVGIDLGLHDLAVCSDGERTPTPKFFRKAQRKLRRAQRVVSRREKGSARRLRANRKVALVHRKAANQRADFLHKLTTGLVKKYDGICIEDLNVKGLVKTKLAKSMMDASFGEFRRQLTYKSSWYRRHLAVIDRWYPSSKTCHACGAANDALTMADRTWTCACGVQLDRDRNAACNIRSEGLKILQAGHAESLNARGPSVRLPKLEAVGVEA